MTMVRTMWRTTLFAGLLGLGLTHEMAFVDAREEQDDFGGEEKAAEEKPGEPSQVSELHVVENQDTLWDLCQRYLNSPWYWPKIWSYNPQISNPHWIYPGNELRFYPSDENLPTNVEASDVRTLSEDDNLEIPDSLDAEDLVRASGDLRTSQQVAPTSVWTAYKGFLSKKAVERSGRIRNAQPEPEMLDDYDRLYVDFKEPARKGEDLAVYHLDREIFHPVTGESYGWTVEIVAGVSIVETNPKVATAMVAQAYRPILRGDLVGPWPENYGTRVAPVPNDTETRGYIIASMGDVIGAVGEQHFVYLDRGRKHGVQRGNLFQVVRAGDEFTLETQDLPDEDIGQLMVLDVEEDSSSAIVIHSIHELDIGERVEMRRSAPEL
jgi:hypothetical protein